MDWIFRNKSILNPCNCRLWRKHRFSRDSYKIRNKYLSINQYLVQFVQRLHTRNNTEYNYIPLYLNPSPVLQYCIFPNTDVLHQNTDTFPNRKLRSTPLDIGYNLFPSNSHELQILGKFEDCTDISYVS